MYTGRCELTRVGRRRKCVAKVVFPSIVAAMLPPVQEEAVEEGASEENKVVESPRLGVPSSAEEPEAGPGSTAGLRAVSVGCACGKAD